MAVRFKKSYGKVSRAGYGFGPIQYEATWKTTVPSLGRCYVLVTSDNRVLGKEVASEDTVLTTGTVFAPWKFGLQAAPTGTMSVIWK